MKTGIASTRLIKDNDVPLKQGSSVTVNWGGKIVQAEILALHGKSEFVLTDIQAFQNEKIGDLFVRELFANSATSSPLLHMNVAL